MIQTITGDDTLTLFDRVMGDLADGDTSVITFPNDLADLKTGKKGNSIYVKNETGSNAEMVLRIVKGSSDDKFLQGKLAGQNNDFPSFVLATGEFVKRFGDGEGAVSRDIYNLTGGIFSKNVEAKENVEGDIEQAISIYNFKFSNVVRSIG